MAIYGHQDVLGLLGDRRQQTDCSTNLLTSPTLLAHTSAVHMLNVQPGGGGGGGMVAIYRGTPASPS